MPLPYCFKALYSTFQVMVVKLFDVDHRSGTNNKPQFLEHFAARCFSKLF